MAESAFNKIYADDPKKAAHMTARSELMMAVQDLIKSSGMNNSEAAEMLGASRSSISELMNGKINRISLDSLTKWLSILSGGALRVGIVKVKKADRAEPAVVKIAAYA